jgi:hypothetical protein
MKALYRRYSAGSMRRWPLWVQWCHGRPTSRTWPIIGRSWVRNWKGVNSMLFDRSLWIESLISIRSWLRGIRYYSSLGRHWNRRLMLRWVKWGTHWIYSLTKNLNRLIFMNWKQKCAHSLKECFQKSHQSNLRIRKSMIVLFQEYWGLMKKTQINLAISQSSLQTAKK